jgi:hypothetical protein
VLPEKIILERQFRLRGSRGRSLVRCGSLPLLAVVPILALLNVFGERAPQTIATLGDVEWAILETSGKISFIPKSG